MEAFFSCHPPPSKCEWGSTVRSFAEEYNRLKQADYVLETCFEPYPPGVPIPEVRLVATSGPPMVVERKTVMWPEDYLHAHSRWHALADYLSEALSCRLNEPTSIYIRSEYLRGLSKREVRRVGNSIVRQIESGKNRGVVSCGAQGGMPWCIRPYLFLAPEGMKVEVVDEDLSADPLCDLQLFNRVRDEQIAGYRARLAKCLQRVEKKFAAFTDHRRVLLVQVVGESSALFEETDLPAIMEVVDDANFLDEVWIASKDWVSEDDFRILWVPFLPGAGGDSPTGAAV